MAEPPRAQSSPATRLSKLGHPTNSLPALLAEPLVILVRLYPLQCAAAHLVRTHPPHGPLPGSRATQLHRDNIQDHTLIVSRHSRVQGTGSRFQASHKLLITKDIPACAIMVGIQSIPHVPCWNYHSMRYLYQICGKTHGCEIMSGVNFLVFADEFIGLLRLIL